MNFKGLEQILDAAFYQYVSDNDDNPAPLHTKKTLYLSKCFFYSFSGFRKGGGGYYWILSDVSMPHLPLSIHF